MKRVLVIVVFAVSVSACGGGTTVSTVAPTPAAPTAAAPAPAPRPSAATLAVSSFDVTFDNYSSGRYWYRPNMVLTETSGKSSATLQSISFSILNGDTYFVTAPVVANGQGCFLTSESKVVGAGQAWNLNSVYYYCLDIDSRNDLTGTPITVAITFVDEDGHQGTVKNTVVVNK
ncbi:MAG TPA: hypothetical protein VMZ66_02465 [Aeromicrobium sp.]|nr:hypothetical protein [Aeromicrobium sp.]